MEEILENWLKIKPVIMEEWSENREALIELSGKVRDEWMDTDFTTWIGANRYSKLMSFVEIGARHLILYFPTNILSL